mgnify:CR=1 FL=1
MVCRLSARGALLGSIALAALTLAQPALAQDATTAEPGPPADAQTTEEAATASDTEIVVTARRRNEILLDVPIAVTAYSGEQLERQGALDITDVSDTTPNVNLETSRGTNTTLTAFIRGVGQQDPVAGFEQGVGIYIDDVYLNRPQGALLDIYDVERIEILRGPQGTLYGRNTIGGAVKYVTRRLPKDRELRMRANLGTYEQADLVLSVAQPLSDAFRVGGAFARLSRGGFGKNLTTGQENYNKDIYAARGTIEFEPAETAFFRLSGDYTWDYSNARGGHRLIPGLVSGAPVLDDEFDSRGGLLDPKQKVKGGGAALHGEIGLNDWLKLKSITAYRKDRSDTPIDFDALPAVDVDVPAIYRNKQFSQEFQLVADKGDRPVPALCAQLVHGGAAVDELLHVEAGPIGPRDHLLDQAGLREVVLRILDTERVPPAEAEDLERRVEAQRGATLAPLHGHAVQPTTRLRQVAEDVAAELVDVAALGVVEREGRRPRQPRADVDRLGGQTPTDDREDPSTAATRPGLGEYPAAPRRSHQPSAGTG